MLAGSVFVDNHHQCVRLSGEAGSPYGVKQVNVRVVGDERILSLNDNIWDRFFLSEEHGSDDFIVERSPQATDKV